ncbi:hypothetical protein [Actinomadura litoris]|uniref:Uncharacterized protein n=1 Tax=Actinomadura litoris TaxID=2678616 RepID=A0A7K1LAJ8_9ACTN|nr:hypothetical protein [Actinomadura litoris]MUN41461.1 hypothetical protein [Actinomadura litoris]
MPTDPTPPEPALRDQLAEAIRATVRIKPGPRAVADLAAGRSIPISGGEADVAALAVLPVFEAALATVRASRDRAHQAAVAFERRAIASAKRAEQAEAALQRAQELVDLLDQNVPEAEGNEQLRRLISLFHAVLDQPGVTP